MTSWKAIGTDAPGGKIVADFDDFIASNVNVNGVWTLSVYDDSVHNDVSILEIKDFILMT